MVGDAQNILPQYYNNKNNKQFSRNLEECQSSGINDNFPSPFPKLDKQESKTAQSNSERGRTTILSSLHALDLKNGFVLLSHAC